MYLFPIRLKSAPGTSQSMRYRIASGALPDSQAYRPSIQLPSRTATAQVHDTLLDPSRHVLVRMWTCICKSIAIMTSSQLIANQCLLLNNGSMGSAAQRPLKGLLTPSCGWFWEIMTRLAGHYDVVFSFVLRVHHQVCACKTTTPCV